MMNKKPPIHCLVPGTKFTVDWHCKVSDEFKHSFLTHAHEDHLKGIRSFRSPRVLHCTSITAKMLLIKVPNIKNCLSICEVGKPFEVDGVVVNVLDANHTPGSAMFLFTLKNGEKILFTGDFRAEKSVIQSAKVYSPIKKLFIDCTYAESGLNIPERKICVDFIISKLKEFLPLGYLAILGTYTIGKEEAIFEIADTLATYVYAPEARLKSIKDLINSDYRKSEFFTDDLSKARIHLLSIAKCSYEGVLEHTASLNENKILVIKLTGWSSGSDWMIPMITEIRGKRIVMFSVPYSDHSSPSELIDFVKEMKPISICSITDFTDKAKLKIQKMFLPYLRKEKNKSFIEYYASQQSSPEKKYEEENETKIGN